MWCISRLKMPKALTCWSFEPPPHASSNQQPQSGDLFLGACVAIEITGGARRRNAERGKADCTCQCASLGQQRQQWTRYLSSKRPSNFPYHYLTRDGNIGFYRPLPKVVAQRELGLDQQDAQDDQGAAQRRREGASRHQDAQLEGVNRRLYTNTATRDSRSSGFR